MKTKMALLSLATAAQWFAQQPAAAIVQHSALPAAAIPVAGYVVDAGAVQIRPILGTARKARLGDPIPVPGDASGIYLPPRQQYALVETNSDQPLTVWRLLETMRKGLPPQGVPIAGSMGYADVIAFSPRGEAAALYSKDSGRLQVITDLPARPVLVRELSLAGLGEAAQLTLSDDGTLVAVRLTDARLIYSSQGRDWQPLSAQYSPTAWSFVPSAHDLVMADPSQSAVAFYRELDGRLQLSSVVGLRADRLSFTKDGRQLLAGASSDGNLWSWQLASGTMTSLPTGGRLDTLSCLRDGWTFLLSTSPALSLVKVVGGAQAETRASAGPEKHAVLF
jgi:hypothetical protein